MPSNTWHDWAGIRSNEIAKIKGSARDIAADNFTITYCLPVSSSQLMGSPATNCRPRACILLGRFRCTWTTTRASCSIAFRQGWVNPPQPLLSVCGVWQPLPQTLQQQLWQQHCIHRFNENGRIWIVYITTLWHTIKASIDWTLLMQ